MDKITDSITNKMDFYIRKGLMVIDTLHNHLNIPDYQTLVVKTMCLNGLKSTQTILEKN